MNSTEKTNCGKNDCGCANTQNPKTNSDLQSEPQKKLPEKTLEKKPELDPTHFGDWQVNCRAIDF